MHRAPRPSQAGRVLEPFICPELERLPGIRHGFFTRNGGVSEGIYASLNCAYGTGDKPEHVDENYRRISAALGAKAICKAHQIHSAKVILAGKPWRHNEAPQADAIITATPGLAVGVTTADCLPILLADSENRIVAAVHAGWKGLLGLPTPKRSSGFAQTGGIIEATLETMRKLGAKDIAATIGPAIAQGSYEVGAEFYQRFLAESEDNHQYFVHGAREGHYMFDLKAAAKDRLKAGGLTRINVLAHDTCFEENDLFSYRRSTLRKDPSYGCQLSAILIL